MKRWQALGLAVIGVGVLTLIVIFWHRDVETEYGCRNVKKEFQAVCRLADLGLNAEAAEQLQKVVNANPSFNVPNSLEYLSGGNPAFWRQAQQLFGQWKQFAAGMLIALAVVYLTLWRFLGKSRLDIRDFDKGATELEIGTALAAIVEDSLKQFEQQGDRLSVDVIARLITEVALPTEIKSVLSLKIASQVIDWFLPKKVITLSGYLHKPGDRGAGLAMVLVDKRGKISQSNTLWQKDYDPMMAPPAEKTPSSYYQLAGLAATWVCFQLKALEGYGDHYG